MKKALTTIGTGPLSGVLAVTRPTFLAYATRHGYTYVEGAGDALGRPPAWAKVLLIRQLLDAFDLVVWIDADAIILDARGDIADEIRGDTFQALVEHRLTVQMVEGAPTEHYELPNTGVWALRSTPRAKEFLDSIWASTELIHHPWWENAAVMELLGYRTDRPWRRWQDTEWFAGTTWLDTSWNGHVQIVGIRKDRIRHYAGLSNRARFVLMMLDRVPILGQLMLEQIWRAREWEVARSRGYLRPRN